MRDLEGFSEHVCQLVFGANKVSGDFPWVHLLPCIITVYLNVVGLFLEDWIGCDVENNLIATYEPGVWSVSKF